MGKKQHVLVIASAVLLSALCFGRLAASAGDTQAPAAPAGLTVSAPSDNVLNLTWNASSDNVGVTGYKVYRNGSYVTTTAGLSLTENHFMAGTSTIYNVTAIDAAGNESLLSPSALGTTTGAAAGAPKIWGVTIANVTAGSASILWTTDSDSSSQVDYGTSLSYGLTASDNTLTKVHRIDLSGLASGAVYQIRICSTAGGATGCFDAGSFTASPKNASVLPVGQTILGSEGSYGDGNGTTRIEVSWSNLEPVKGAYNQAFLDSIDVEVNQALSHGQDPVILLDYGVGWAKIWTNAYQAKYRVSAFGPPDYQVDWTRFAEKVMSYFKGKVTKYEVYNEPDAGYLSLPQVTLDPQFTEQYWIQHRYTSLAYGARTAADRIDPSIRLIAPSWNHDYHASRAGWIFDLGLQNWFDYYSFHIYTSQWNYGKWLYWFKMRYLTYLDAKFVSYETSKPLALTEFGWPVITDPHSPDPNAGAGFLNETDQARALWKMTFTILNERRFSYVIHFATFGQEAYSLFWNNDPSDPKPGYYAWKAIAGLFTNQTVQPYSTASVENGDANTNFFALRLQERDDVLIGLWQSKYNESLVTNKYATLPAKTVTAKLPPPPSGFQWKVSKLDLAGNETSQTVAVTTDGVRWDVTLGANTLMEESDPNVFRARLISTSDTESPSPPGNLTFTGKTEQSVTLAWTASTDNTGVTGYDIYSGTNRIGSTNGTSFKVPDLIPNTAYSFTVKARDHADNLSADSNTLIVTTDPDVTAPTAPSMLSLNRSVLPPVTDTSVSLSWSPSADYIGLTGYDVYSGSSLIGSSQLPNITLNNLSAGTSYLLTVVAKDAAGNRSAASKPFCVTTGTPTNSVSNGNFDLNPVNSGCWNTFTRSGNPSFIWASDYTHSGAYSAKISGSSKISGGFSRAGPNAIAIDSNNTYRLTAWIKTKGVSATKGDGAFIWIEQTDEADVSLPNTKWESIYLTGTNDWTPITTTITPQLTAAKLRIYIQLRGSGTAWFDDIALTPADVTAPSAPTNVTASTITDSSLTLSWDNSTDDTGVSAYYVFAGTKLLGTSFTNTFKAGGLSPETAYSFTVKAKDSTGNLSPASAPVTLTTLKTNLAFNGGFEASPINANGWKTHIWVGTPTFTWATDNVHGGVSSAKISGTSIHGGFDKSTINAIYVTPGDAYHVTVWLKTDGISSASGDGAYFYIEQTDYNDAVISGTRMDSARYTGTNDWMKLTMSFTAAADAAKVKVYVNMKGSGSAWYDDIAVDQ